jgi:hypothetical protein
MSSLWTPDGEKPVNSQPPAGEASSQEAPSPEQLEELRAQLAETPASIIVANHCFGLFELAALHLSLSPPQLDQAQVAIDALGAVVEALEGRLGEVEPQLLEGVTQLRMAFVQIRQAGEAAAADTSTNQN